LFLTHEHSAAPGVPPIVFYVAAMTLFNVDGGLYVLVSANNDGWKEVIQVKYGSIAVISDRMRQRLINS
jgi:hypothetical protein